MAARINHPDPSDLMNEGEEQGQGYDLAQDLPIEEGEEEIQAADQEPRTQGVGAAYCRGRPPPPPPFPRQNPSFQQYRNNYDDDEGSPFNNRLVPPHNATARAHSQETPPKNLLLHHHYDKLEDPDKFNEWERRIKSAINAIPGYEDQLMGRGRIDFHIQEQILNFLVQQVREPGGFDKLNAVECRQVTPGSARGRDAWKVITDHYKQVGTARTSAILTDFMRHQQPHETADAFVTRVINKRLEAKQAGVEIAVEQVRALLLDGLRHEYQQGWP
jgi:hypothetical protein